MFLFYNFFVKIQGGIYGDWRSWLARTHGVREATGSSPVSPTLSDKNGPAGPVLDGVIVRGDRPTKRDYPD